MQIRHDDLQGGSVPRRYRNDLLQSPIGVQDITNRCAVEIPTDEEADIIVVFRSEDLNGVNNVIYSFLFVP